MRAGCLALLSVVVLSNAVAHADDAPVHHIGKVVMLESVADKLAPGQKARGLGLLTDAGKVYPLVRDKTTQLFYQDEQLQNRPMRLTGVVQADATLKVSLVRSLKDGKLHEIYYWCEKCQLAATELGACICCGAQVQLREDPVSD